MSDPQEPRRRPRELFGVRPGFGFWVGAVVLLAFLIREYFVLVAVVDIPLRGDIREYVNYAWNLYHHGVFSMVPPQATPPSPDAFRSPGYPWLLMVCMLLKPHGDSWYSLALQMQVVLGTATVWLTMLSARLWLDRAWPILAGVLMAIWPHHVAATGALLSEVAFGFTLMAGLYFLTRAFDGPRPCFIVLAALAFGYAYLINPLIALFPPVIALLIWRERSGRAALIFTSIFLAPLLAFALRSALLENHGNQTERVGRAAINFVQGAWPEYHWAWQMQRFGEPNAIAVMRDISAETAALSASPMTGLSTIAKRLRERPAQYAVWYLWHKPWLLWSWEIQIGPGGVYVLDVRNSPLETHPILRWATAALRLSNPLLSLLALGGMLAMLYGGLLRKPWAPTAALATAALALYLTAVHTIFQAEPRYANSYRGIEILLLVTSLKALIDAALRYGKAMPSPQCDA
jgi:hypothetical protein